jgi:Flp pilus assembly protein protease CpaA
MPISIITLIALFVCMVFDLRLHTIPPALSIGFLVGSAIFSVSQTIWAPVGIVIILILVSDINPKYLRLIGSTASLILSSILQPEYAAIHLALFGIWFLWELKALGGADVKLLFGLLLLFPNPSILIPIALLGGIQGVFAKIRKQKEIPFVVSIFGGTVIYTLLPILQSLKGG